VGEDRGSGGAKRSVVVGVVEVPVGVNDAFHGRVSQAVESLFEPGPGRRNESVHDEFSVGAVEDYHASPGSGEHRDIFTESLRFEGSGVELGAHTREQVGRRRRLLPVARHGRWEQRRWKEGRQEGAAGQRD
jgi:hypothetical protein